MTCNGCGVSTMAADGGSRMDSVKKICIFILISLTLSICYSQIIPKKKYCADSECSGKISNLNRDRITPVNFVKIGTGDPNLFLGRSTKKLKVLRMR